MDPCGIDLSSQENSNTDNNAEGSSLPTIGACCVIHKEYECPPADKVNGMAPKDVVETQTTTNTVGNCGGGRERRGLRRAHGLVAFTLW